MLDWGKVLSHYNSLVCTCDPERACRPRRSRADRLRSRTPAVPPTSGWSVSSFPAEQHNAKLHYAWIPSGSNLERRTQSNTWTRTSSRKKFFKGELGQHRETETSRGVWTETQSSVTSDLAAAFCSCFILMASSLTGLGMNVMSAPSFTSRPIHQSLLYFCTMTTRHNFYHLEVLLRMCCWHGHKLTSAVTILMVKASHLFYVQKVFGFKVNCRTLDWTIFIKGPAVTHIGFYCKCYWFGLWKD